MDRTLALMLVFFGGGLGCLIRYATSPDPNNPFMVANIVACLVIGVLYALTRHKVITNIYVQSFVTVGFLGGLSTFTPLATYAIVQSEPNFIFSFLLFIGYLAAFFVISLVGYIPATLYCQKVMHLQPVPSIVAVVRNRKSSYSKRQEEKIKEAKSQQYTNMLKELSVAKEMLSKLQEQTAALGELAKRSPQAAREYSKAKIKIAELQRKLQVHQAKITQLDPLKGQAPDGLKAAPGFTDEEQSLAERKQARDAAQAIAQSQTEEMQQTAKTVDGKEQSKDAGAKPEVTYFGEFGVVEIPNTPEQDDKAQAESASEPEKDTAATENSVDSASAINSAGDADGVDGVEASKQADDQLEAKQPEQTEQPNQKQAEQTKPNEPQAQGSSQQQAQQTGKTSKQSKPNANTKANTGSKPNRPKSNTQQATKGKYPAKPQSKGKRKSK